MRGTARNRELARRFREDLWNTADLRIADEILAEDCLIHARVPFASGFARGPDALRQLVLFYHLAFSDIRMKVDELIAQGDTVAARWTGRGRVRGEPPGPPPPASAPAAPSPGSPPTPPPVVPQAETVTSGIDFLRFADGRIVEGWVAWDILSLIEPFLSAKIAAPSSLPLAQLLPLLKQLG
jgi:SnoaL-like polyketide cyclase